MAFTMLCILLFMVPGYLAIYAARHPVVKYFHGHTYYVLIVIPILILIAHLHHTHNGPDKYMTQLAVLIPSVLLLVYGTSLMTNATMKADGLYSIDCATMPEKTHLQREWEAAHNLYQTCLSDTAASRNLTSSYLTNHFRLQDCVEYESSLREHWRDWTYLQQLEEQHACTGFCRPSVQLWSNGPHKDACSIVVASVFRYIVEGNCMKVVTISLVTLVLDMLLVLCLAPMLRSAGKGF